MDAFSEVLNGVRLKGAMFFRAEFSAPWQLSTPHCRALAPTLAPGAPHMLIYHFVVDGSARVCLEGEPEVELSPGDIVLFPHGDPHHLSSGSGSNQLDGAALLRKVATHDLSPMRAGGGGAMTGFVCGYLTCDPLLCGPILESLPPMLKVNIRTDRSGHWLEAPRAWRGEFDNHRGTAARNLDVDVQITHRNAVYGIAGADDQPHRLPSQDPND